MIDRVVAWSARNWRVVVAAALVAALGGELARRELPRDVLPDLSDPQIVLVAEWMGHPADEVARSVTAVLTGALEGVPGSTAVRGSSMAGMAFVEVVFRSSADLARGRKAMVERVSHTRSRLPPGVHTEVGPAASSAGWVFQYALVDRSGRTSPRALRRYQDEILRPYLSSIPGVAEVAAVGGTPERVLVQPRADDLGASGLAFTDVLGALRPAFQWHGSMTFEAIGWQPIPASTASPPRTPPLTIGRVARVRMVDDAPGGLADLGGTLQAVGGIVVARPGADLGAVIRQIEGALVRARSSAPAGIEIVTVYDRLDLVTRVGKTLLRALAEEVAVVVLVVLVFLLHGRSAMVPLATLPMVLLLTFAGMWILKVPATIMSLGGIGIALGMAVDADIVALEACHRRLETRGAAAAPVLAGDRRATLVDAAGSFAPAILTSLVIAALTFLPVMAFTGETGRLLRPLALTKTLVVASAAVVTLTLAPALRDRLLRGRVKPELDNPLTRSLVRIYRPFVHFALTRPVLTLVTAAVAVASCLPIVLRLGTEFLPRIDEGDLLYMPTTRPGVSAADAAAELRRQNQAIQRFGEVATVFGKVGRADSATDPAPLSMVETTIRLVPPGDRPKVARQRWYSGWAPPALGRWLGLVWPEQTERTTAELVDSLDRATRLPGWTNAWTAPVRARMDMMSTGVRTPVGIRISAAGPERLDALGAALRKIVLGVPGTRSAVFEALGDEPGLGFQLDAAALALHRVDPELARSTAALVLGGGYVGEIMIDPGFRRVPVHLVPGAEGGPRAILQQLREVTVRSGDRGTGRPVPLALLGRLVFVSHPAAIRTEGGNFVAYVYVDLAAGTDLVGYVDRARREVARAIETRALTLAGHEAIDWTGQYPLIVAGEKRLRWIAPVVALTMLGLLFLQFRSLTQALIILVSVPFALVGSFWTLYLLGYQLSAPVWVGLLSTVGLAMQTGVVMVVYIDQAFHRRLREGRVRGREDIVAAHAEGTVLRLRPKIMTITTMAASLLPLLWATGAGAEVMKRVAAPMVGGLATSAFLTLEVLPVIYTIWRHRQIRKAQRLGVAVETIVGPAPAWTRPRA